MINRERIQKAFGLARAFVIGLEKSRVALIAAITVGVLLLAMLAGWLLLRRSASNEGEFDARVTEPVTITRDVNGIPLIGAKTWEDAIFAVGCVHAQDRLLLIEYYRAIASGRLSSRIGDEGAAMDRLSQAVGFSHRAEAIVKKLNPAHRALLESYVRGVNFSRSNKFGEILSSSALAGGDWTPGDVVSVLLLFEWSNAFLSNRELLFAFNEEAAGYQLKDIIPADMIFWFSDSESEEIAVLREIKKTVKKFIAPPSSGFAVHVPGGRTTEDRARLMFNLDSSVRVYPAWYPVILRVGERRLEGVTTAGLPFVLIGKNDTLSFASFPVKADTQDFYLEETRVSGDSEQYLSRGMWRDFDRVEGEAVPPAGENPPHGHFEARATERGPVVSDAMRDLYKTSVISMRALFPDEGYIASLFDLPQADTLDKARRLLVNLNSPPRVYLLGEGDRAQKVFAGKVPLRTYPDRIFKRDEAGTWMGLLDLSVNFRQSDRDILIAGDSMIEDEPPVFKNYLLVNDANRLARVRELVEAVNYLDGPYMRDVLRDTFSITAYYYAPLLITLLEQIPITSARLSRIYLHDWDFAIRVKSVPAAIYQVLVVRLIQETLSDELKGDVDVVLENHYLIVDKFFEAFLSEKSLLFDDIGTKDKMEFRDTIFDRALLKTLRYFNNAKGPIMEEWRWGDLHTGRFKIPFIEETSFPVRRFFDNESYAIPGANSTIRRSTFNAQNDYSAEEVSALSGIVGDKETEFSALYGSSINPLSVFFGNFAERKEFAAFKTDSRLYRMRLVPMK